MPLKNFSLYIVFTLFFFIAGSAQESDPNKESIAKHIEDYFFLERENIHLQIDKSTFLSNEDIWFKGYVYHRKKKLPFFTTTNVYATLYDENGTKVKDKLLYTNNGTFSGKFELGDTFKSGKYYIQVFTNWMNNFKEDESSVFEIDVINKNEKTALLKSRPDNSKINIDFYPEGGSIIDGTLNNIGIKISDCNGKPLSITEAEILDSDNKSMQNVAINKFGLGKFQIIATSKASKISLQINGEKVEKNLPFSSPNGLALEVNNYAFKDKTAIKIRTNQKSLEQLKSKKMYLVIQQDDKSTIFDVNFSNNNLEQSLIFSNEDLFEGVNAIRLIDSDKKQLAERYIFKYPKDFLTLELGLPKKTKDSITFTGRLNFPNNSISISVVPEQSLALNQDNTIFSSFLLNPYLAGNYADARYYFEEISKIKQYAIDLLLLNQNSGKYKWEDIISVPPKNTYDFDFGISLKGTLNQTLKDRKKFRTKLFSIKAEINESSEINEKNEFYFHNLILADSTWVNFTLVDDKNKSTPLKVYPQLLNGRRLFNKAFTPTKKECASVEKIEYELPGFIEGTIMLDDVEIAVDKKKKLKYSNTLGNGNLRGYKVEENDDTDVLNYIRNNGFEVPNNTTSLSVEIYGRSITTINGARSTPVLFIDGLQQMNFDLLLNMRMSEIDEIYINPNAIVPSVNNNQGIIKIYRRTTGKSGSNKTDAIPFEIKNAFSKIENFKNSSYVLTSDKGFQNFGIINWIPSILTQENGNFKFQIPNMNQKSIKIVIEGFSADGKLISEIRTISLPQ